MEPDTTTPPVTPGADATQMPAETPVAGTGLPAEEEQAAGASSAPMA